MTGENDSRRAMDAFTRIVEEIFRQSRYAFDGLDSPQRPVKNMILGDIGLELFQQRQSCEDPSLRQFLQFMAYCYPRAGRSMSQLAQDLWVLYMTGEVRGGVFVEVGAGDGVRHSNTYLLEKSYGWTGVLVEPNIHQAAHIEKHRDARLSRKAVLGQSGQKVALQIMDDPYLSRVKDHHAIDLHDRLGTRRMVEQITVESQTFDDLLQEHELSHVDFLSLDTEGSELEILRSIDFDKRRVPLLCVEHNWGENIGAIHDLMVSKGYRSWLSEFMRSDFFFVHEGYLAETMQRLGARTRRRGGQAAAELTRQEQAAADAQREAHEARALLEARDREIAETRGAFNEIRQRLEEQAGSLSAALAERERELARANAGLDQLRQDADAADTAVQAAKREAESARSDAAAALARLAEAEDQLAQAKVLLEDARTAAARELASVNAMLEATSAGADQARLEAAELKAAVEHLRERLATAETLAAEEGARAGQLAGLLEQARQREAEAERTVSDLLNAQREEREAAMLELDRARLARDADATEIETLAGQVRELEARVAAGIEETTALRARCQEMEAAAASADRQLALLHTQLAGDAARLEAEARRAQEATDRLNASEADRRALSMQLSELAQMQDRRYSELSARLVESAAAHVAATERAAAMEAELRERLVIAEATKVRLAETESRLHLAQVDLERLANDRLQAGERILSLEKLLEGLTAERAADLEAAAAKDADLARLADEMRRVEEDGAALRLEVSEARQAIGRLQHDLDVRTGELQQAVAREADARSLIQAREEAFAILEAEAAVSATEYRQVVDALRALAMETGGASGDGLAAAMQRIATEVERARNQAAEIDGLRNAIALLQQDFAASLQVLADERDEQRRTMQIQADELEKLQTSSMELLGELARLREASEALAAEKARLHAAVDALVIERDRAVASMDTLQRQADEAVAVQRRRADELEHDLAARMRERDEARAQLAASLAEKDSLVHQMGRLVLRGPETPPPARPTAAEQEAARLRAEVAALRASTSWRITAPIRSIGRILRSRKS